MNLQSLRENRFTSQPMDTAPAEELFAQDWDTLLNSATNAAWELLRDVCIELNFPVEEGKSKSPEMLAALTRGILPENREGAWVPKAPDKIRVYLHETPVGRLPVIECESDADFIRIQQSLVYRCEPRPVPEARGASIIKNYNNWARVNMHRENGKLPGNPALYRDYLMLLSHRYYSGCAPELFGLESADWRQKSLVLRREHEASHYMTQRYYHSSVNAIHDELIADFMGLTAVFGEYDPAKFLTFLGLENPHSYRKGGRLEIYKNGEPDEDADFEAVCAVVRQAAQNLAENFRAGSGDRMDMFHSLCRSSVADMAEGRFAPL